MTSRRQSADRIVDPLIAELRTLRTILGVRATDVADATGLNLATLSLWECGHNLPRVEKLRAYAGALGFALTLVPTEEAAAADTRAALLALTPAEIRALADSARAWLQLGDEPILRSALGKLTAAEPEPIDTIPGRPHRDEPPLDRPVVDVHLPAHDIA
ncbi:helix-turn-helix domain-containing protein [Micromonospora sp. S-DT3-3-22]|uniref:helix-turn-helix domain-containing protein n=1 Tax=Micromonospora sp. S-DT3-3-22 TaxID=2755359 RepID=UPI00188E3411|nr:helix-turn-helix transcriptional regulator [Micromonospora sp. S-DT3-3-22]